MPPPPEADFIKRVGIQNNHDMNTHRIITMIALLFAAVAAHAQEPEQAEANEKIVRDYLRAFNERDVARMAGMVTEDVQWISINGDKLTVDADRREALVASMRGYFKSPYAATSTLEWIQTTPSRASAFEKATWTAGESTRSQRSLSIYEFRDGLIARVYYHPAEK